MLAIMRSVRDAIYDGDFEKCSFLANHLITSVSNHFRHEEEYLELHEFPGLDEHKIYHAELLIQAKQVKEICENSDKDHNLVECFDAMEKFLIDDILNGDVQFKSFLEYKGLVKRKL